MNAFKTIVILFLMTLTLYSCQTNKKATKSRQQLCDTRWELENLNATNIDTTTYVEKPYIVFFEKGTYSGSTGCNTFFGQYYTKKNKLQLTYGGATKMLCHVMEMERAFLKSLKKETTSYIITDDNKLIIYAGKEEVFQFSNKGKFVDNNN